MIRSEFMVAIKQVATERGIDPEQVLETLKHAMIAAFRKDYPEQISDDDEIIVKIDKETGEVTLSKDRKDITPPGFGRIAAQTAKQVILQGVREAEKDAILEEFRQKIDRITPGMLQRFDKGLWLVDVGRTIVVMPKEEQVHSEEYEHNQRMKFYIKAVQERGGREQVIVSRADPQLVRGLFELEVPEVQSKAVVVKKIAREPGSRTKIAVTSTQEGVDPVGSMVGQRGVRVQAVTNELKGEKMDIILWSDSIIKFIINALSPAKVTDVMIDEGKKTAKVEVPDDQLSLAIGKEGQNVRLASKLTGFTIDIVGTDQAEEEESLELKELGLSTRIVNRLAQAGITTLEQLKLLTPDQLEQTPGIGGKAMGEIEKVLKKAD